MKDNSYEKYEKCYCIEDFYYNDKQLFYQGNYYDFVKELGDKNNGSSYWIIYNPFGTSTTTGFRFWTKRKPGTEDDPHFNIAIFKDHFLYGNDLRKFKLEKINGSCIV